MSNICFQGEPSECGLACIVMTASLIGKPLVLELLRKEISPSNFGLSLHDLEMIGNKNDLHLESVSFDVLDLEFISTPSILHLKTSHYVVLEKINSDTCVILDPTSGRRVLSIKYLRELSTGYALVTDESPVAKRYSLNFLSKKINLEKIDYSLVALAMISTLSAFVFPMFAFSSPERLLTEGVLEWYYLLGFLFLALFGLITNYMLGKRKLLIATKENIKETETAFKKSIKNDIRFFEKRSSIDVVNRISAYANAKSEMSLFYYSVGISTFVSVISLGILLYIDAIITSLVLFFMIISFSISAIHRSKAKVFQSQTLDYSEDIDRKIIDSCYSSTAIKEASGLRGCTSSLRSILVNFRQFKINEYEKTFLFSSAVSISDTFNNVAMMYLLFAGVVQGGADVGSAFSFILIKGIFSGSVNDLFDLYIRSGEINVAIDRSKDLLTFANDPIFGPQNRSQNHDYAEISTLGLSYCVIKSIKSNEIYFPDFSMGNSKMLIISGSSGTGKSTLLKLLAGHYKLSSGKIYLNGDVATREMLRDCSYYHSQIQSFIEGSILENIRLFNDGVTRDKIEEVLDKLSAWKIVEALPYGLDSKISEGYNPFSVGEKQRLLLARAFVSNKKVILLDEPTSSLDDENSLNIFNKIIDFDKTVIMVTHNKEIISNNNGIYLG